MSKRSIDVLLEDMLDAIQKIERYTNGMSQDIFEEDEKTVDAVIRNLEIIGEAANRLPKDFINKRPEIEWVKIIGFRNRIVHEYFGVDLKIIWQIIQKDLPPFRDSLIAIRSSIAD